MARFLVLLVFIFAPLVPGFALTIDEAVDQALETSDTIKQQQETMAASKYGVDNAIMIYFPVIGVSYEYSYMWNNRNNLNMGSSGSGGASMYSGGNYHGGYSTATAYATLNIFNGLNDYSTVEIAKLNYGMAGNQLENISYNVTLNAQTSFINVLKAQSSLKVAMSNLELLKLQKRDAELSAANGLIAKTDVLQIDTYLATAELQRISAESDLKIAVKTLENVINRRLTPGEVLVEPPFDMVKLPDVQTLKATMYENRSDLKYLEQSYQTSKKNETMSLSGVYPKIDVSANYNRYGDDFNPFQGYEYQLRDEVATIGFTASWNLLSIATSSVASMSKKRETQAIAYSIADTKKSMSLDLDTALATYETSHAQLAQSKISVQYALENYRVKKNLYDQNAATQTDLLDAAQILNQARLDESNAIYNVIASIYNLERIVQEKFTVEKPEKLQPDNIIIEQRLNDNMTAPGAGASGSSPAGSPR